MQCLLVIRLVEARKSKDSVNPGRVDLGRAMLAIIETIETKCNSPHVKPKKSRLSRQKHESKRHPVVVCSQLFKACSGRGGRLFRSGEV